MSILEKNREISSETLLKYLPPAPLTNLPMRLKEEHGSGNEYSERELLYKVLFEMKKDMNDMKLLINDVIKGGIEDSSWKEHHAPVLDNLKSNLGSLSPVQESTVMIHNPSQSGNMKVSNIDRHEEVEESLSLEEKEKEFIQKALQKHRGRRKLAAKELGISERTLYRKMNEYNIH